MKRIIISALYISLSIALFAQDDINLLDLIKDDSTTVQTTEQPASLPAAESSVSEIPAPEWDWRAHRHSLSVTIGSPSLLSGTTGILIALFEAFDNSTNTDLHIYGSYGIHYGYNALKWLRVGGSLLYSGDKLKKTGSNNYVHIQQFHELYLIGKLDFTYLNRKYVRLYSGLGLGGGLMIMNDQSSMSGVRPERTHSLAPSVAYYVTPIGIEAGGQRVYGLTEINIGTADLIRAGIGVRL